MEISKLSEIPKDYSGKVIMIRKNGSRRVFTVNNQPSLTDQQWKKDCDVNSIIASHHKTGQIPHLAKIQGQFADVSEIQDLLPSLMKVEIASQSFLKLPPATRSRFGNKMENMITFLQDPKNSDEAIKLGLKNVPKPPPEPKVPVEKPPLPFKEKQTPPKTIQDPPK